MSIRGLHPPRSTPFRNGSLLVHSDMPISDTRQRKPVFACQWVLRKHDISLKRSRDPGQDSVPGPEAASALHITESRTCSYQPEGAEGCFMCIDTL